MANYNILFAKIMKWEGGYVNDHLDKGGETKFGITKKTLQYAFKKGYINKYNVADLTIDDAKIIFKAMFWNDCNGDDIYNQSIANIFIDWYWNSGNIAKIRVQKQLPNIVRDGIIGKQTIRAINDYENQEELFDKIKRSRIEFVNSICLISEAKLKTAIINYNNERYNLIDKKDYNINLIANLSKIYTSKDIDNLYIKERDKLQYTQYRFFKGWLNRINDFKF